MIQVQRLSKRYTKVKAVDDVSFEVKKRDIVGFLGPNGAGKSTTMKILCGFLRADRGEVRVAGHDVMTDSLEARRKIGYLPERCPLYLDMRVDEYLHHRAALKGVKGKLRQERIDIVKEQCSITDVGRRIIGHLSKGYRQRVGLADALVHDPELLILDEPTQGLDPHQIRHVRELISELSQEHTVLLSTHILPEVEMICKRVIIIHHGQILAADTLNNLQSEWCGEPQIVAELRGAPVKEITRVLKTLPGVQRVKAMVRNSWVVARISESGKNGDLREAIFQEVVKQKWKLRLLQPERRSLEDVFMEVTQSRTANGT